MTLKSRAIIRHSLVPDLHVRSMTLLWAAWELRLFWVINSQPSTILLCCLCVLLFKVNNGFRAHAAAVANSITFN